MRGVTMAFVVMALLVLLMVFCACGCLIKSEATIKTTSKIDSDSHITIHRPDKRRPRKVYEDRGADRLGGGADRLGGGGSGGMKQ